MCQALPLHACLLLVQGVSVLPAERQSHQDRDAASKQAQPVALKMAIQKHSAESAHFKLGKQQGTV